MPAAKIEVAASGKVLGDDARIGELDQDSLALLGPKFRVVGSGSSGLRLQRRRHRGRATDRLHF